MVGVDLVEAPLGSTLRTLDIFLLGNVAAARAGSGRVARRRGGLRRRDGGNAEGEKDCDENGAHPVPPQLEIHTIVGSVSNPGLLSNLAIRLLLRLARRSAALVNRARAALQSSRSYPALL